jgi:hypothetical protein
MVDIILQHLSAYPTFDVFWHEHNNLLIIPPLYSHGTSQDASIHFRVGFDVEDLLQKLKAS